MHYKRDSRNFYTRLTIRKFKKMKISILFMCLLAVAYATNTEPKGHKDFCRYLECCSDELPCKNIPSANIINIDVWKCILQRAGVMKNDMVDRSKGVAYCMSIIDKEHWEVCQKVEKCIVDECKKIAPYLPESKYYICQLLCVIKKGVIDKIKQCKKSA